MIIRRKQKSYAIPGIGLAKSMINNPGKTLVAGGVIGGTVYGAKKVGDKITGEDINNV